MKGNVAVILGGSGYIAGYTLNYIVENELFDKIYLLDIKEPRKEVWTDKTNAYFSAGQIIFNIADVREALDIESPSVDCIFNYAAIHREPGHEPIEFFETNIKGAYNAVDLAERTNCNEIVFTSSIAPYGHSDIARTEDSQVVPYSPYGSSKLVAEKIHEGWADKNDAHKLVIVRPGVIFGPHEDGNVPRLRDALKKGYFCYVGNKNVRKSGGYVKELVNSIFWVKLRLYEQESNRILYNFSFANPPTLQDYVQNSLSVLNLKRTVPTIPYQGVLALSYVISGLSTLLRIKQPIHPVRIKKLTIDNTIIPSYLIDNGYNFMYSLKDCMMDWKNDTPEEW